MNGRAPAGVVPVPSRQPCRRSAVFRPTASLLKARRFPAGTAPGTCAAGSAGPAVIPLVSRRRRPPRDPGPRRQSPPAAP